MPSAKHATSGGDGSYCCRCSSSVGPAAKVQPNNVDGDIYCPRCFVWVRMAEEPGRFNASQACVVKCQFCEWTSVCFGARPGHGMMCMLCKHGGAMPVRVDAAFIEPWKEAIRATQEQMRKKAAAER